MTKPATNINRNYGVDLLRILAGFMVVSIHVGNFGFQCLENTGRGYYLLWFLRIFSYCAVNIFGLISGYIGIESTKKQFKLGRFLELIAQTLFYQVAGVVLFAVIRPDSVSKFDILKAFIPAQYSYWYVMAYLGLMVLMPFLNAGIHSLAVPELDKLIIMGIILFSCVATVLPGNAFQLESGFSLLWLMILYILGAYIRVRFNAVKFRAGGLVYLACGAALFLQFWLFSAHDIQVMGKVIPADMAICYTSPLVLLMAVALLFCFKDIQLSQVWRSAIRFAAPLVLGTYLVHLHPVFKREILTGSLEIFRAGSDLKIFFVYVAATALIFGISLVIDYGRYCLFECIKMISQRDRSGVGY